MGKRKKSKKTRKRSTPGCLGRLTRLALKLTAILLLGAASLAGWWWLTWPDVGSLSQRDPEITAFIERSRQAGHQVRWTMVPGEAISDQLRIAVLVAEDIGFFQHNGFAADEIEAALRTAIEKRKPPRGASTISQQLVKNLWLSPSRNPLRKLQEALLTRELERQLNKERILDL